MQNDYKIIIIITVVRRSYVQPILQKYYTIQEKKKKFPLNKEINKNLRAHQPL